MGIKCHRVFFNLLLTVFLLQTAHATRQSPDILIDEGQKYFLYSNPLESFWSKEKPRPHFQIFYTANMRGYIATWEIEQGILYLKAIKGVINNREIVGLESIFPGQYGRLEATWFTGKLRIPQGKILKYGYGYESIYEYDLIIHIQKGKVIKREVIKNELEGFDP